MNGTDSSPDSNPCQSIWSRGSSNWHPSSVASTKSPPPSPDSSRTERLLQETQVRIPREDFLQQQPSEEGIQQTF